MWSALCFVCPSTSGVFLHIRIHCVLHIQVHCVLMFEYIVFYVFEHIMFGPSHENIV